MQSRSDGKSLKLKEESLACYKQKFIHLLTYISSPRTLIICVIEQHTSLAVVSFSHTHTRNKVLPAH